MSTHLPRFSRKALAMSAVAVASAGVASVFMLSLESPVDVWSPNWE